MLDSLVRLIVGGAYPEANAQENRRLRMLVAALVAITLAAALAVVVNVLTGNLDRPGGAMFPLGPTAPAPRPPRPGRGFATGRWHSRVSGYPETASEFPTAALARFDITSLEPGGAALTHFLRPRDLAT